MEVLGEGVRCLGECFGAVSSGRAAEAENDERGMEGKGRQNVVLSHYGAFQKTSRTG